MKQAHGWYLPDHEVHLVGWMAHAKNVRDVVDGRVMYQGSKQRAVIEACQNFGVAVDCGAHCGTWSWTLAKRFAQVQSFEPVAAHRECFLQNVTAENVTLHACALGETEGMVAIQTTNGSSGDSHVVSGDEIPVKTLDSFGFDNVGLIKIDVEGFEEFVIKGATETILRCKPVMIVEQKGHAVPNFGLQKEGAVTLLQDFGMKALRAPMSGDWVMGW